MYCSMYGGIPLTQQLDTSSNQKCVAIAICPLEATSSLVENLHNPIYLDDWPRVKTRQDNLNLPPAKGRNPILSVLTPFEFTSDRVLTVVLFIYYLSRFVLPNLILRMLSLLDFKSIEMQCFILTFDYFCTHFLRTVSETQH